MRHVIVAAAMAVVLLAPSCKGSASNARIEVAEEDGYEYYADTSCCECLATNACFGPHTTQGNCMNSSKGPAFKVYSRCASKYCPLDCINLTVVPD